MPLPLSHSRKNTASVAATMKTSTTPGKAAGSTQRQDPATVTAAGSSPNTTAPAVGLVYTTAAAGTPSGSFSASNSSPFSSVAPPSTVVALIIPEILELVLLHVLKFQSSSCYHVGRQTTNITTILATKGRIQNYIPPISLTLSPHAKALTPSPPPSCSNTFTPKPLSIDIQCQVQAQRPESNHLAFLRVCRHWYEVGEPLIWRDVKWSDSQSRQVHEQIWRQWPRVRRLEFEYGKRTTDMETRASPPQLHLALPLPPLPPPPPALGGGGGLGAGAGAGAAATSLPLNAPVTATPNAAAVVAIVAGGGGGGVAASRAPSPAPGRPSGGSSRMRNLLAGNTNNNGSGFGGGSSGATAAGSTSVSGAGAESLLPASTWSTGLLSIEPGRPNIALRDALNDLATALSKPPLESRSKEQERQVHGQRQEQQQNRHIIPHGQNNSSSSSRFNMSIPLRLQEPRSEAGQPIRPLPRLGAPLLFLPVCPQLTSLTLTGFFRLETFLESILPFVPELRSLDISLRSYEMRDEIRLDKVLMTCPKLQYLSVDKNMIGRVGFAGDQLPLTIFEEESESWSIDDSWKAQKGTSSGDGLEGKDEEEEESDDEVDDEIYAGTEWHRRFAKEIVNPRNVDPTLNSDSDTNTARKDGNSQAIPGVKGDLQPQASAKANYRRLLKQQRQLRRQRPLALKTLKLKKLRMSEQDFLSLVHRCPLLEEMGVCTTTAWSWSPRFLESVSRSCPRIRHLHLATSHTIPLETADNGAVTQHGIVILNNNNVEATAALTNVTQESVLGGLNNPGHLPFLHPHLAQDHQYQSTSQTAIAAAAALEEQHQQRLREVYDPIIGLIKLYPDLISYDARFVKFQDHTLRALQQHCRFLERLDLTDCREVSSNALDEFLRWAPTLRHLSANLVMFRMERLIQVSEQHQKHASFLAKKTRVMRDWGIPGGSDLESGIEDGFDVDLEYMEDEEEKEELVPQWWACQWLETLILGVQNPSLNPNKERRFYQPVEVTAESLFYNRDLQGSSSGSGSSAYAGSASLTKLRRLELTGGQFDLGVGSLPPCSTSPSPLQLQPSSPSSSTSSSPSPYHNNGSDGRYGDSQSPDHGSHHLRTLTEQDHLIMEKRLDLSKSRSLPESTTSTWRGGLNRVRSFISLKPRKQSTRGGGASSPTSGDQTSLSGGGPNPALAERHRSSSESRLASITRSPLDEDGREKDKAKNKDKGKGKAKGESKSRFFSRDKGKQTVLRPGLDASTTPPLPPLPPSLPPPPPPTTLSATVRNGKAPVRGILNDDTYLSDQNHRPYRDPTLAGLRPLANLTLLEHFSMTWANFPRLHEPDIEWICTQWPALRWMSLGLIHVDEWGLIRYWVHKRRRNIVVVFEK
ncbi:hypothetical protein EMPS_01945 [Entomortierella parvispora]|uniref:F-box domain-containing protein n=1 Tax=Entomortierella parvispora TaxID=205924 RepID=A0A9P3H4I0_9FUNG|nr:hypothetical protein EMPS_01945 [Entomortierella parvispora]